MAGADGGDDVGEPPIQPRDAQDAPVLALLLAPAARADLLVTGDGDLLVLAEQFRIMTPRAFCERFGV